MQNTTLNLLEQLTPTQSLAVVAAVLALSCVAWMSIRLLGTLARLALVATAALLFVSVTGLVPNLEAHRDQAFGNLSAELEPLLAGAGEFLSPYTEFGTQLPAIESDEVANEEEAIQTILSQNDGPNGHP